MVLALLCGLLAGCASEPAAVSLSKLGIKNVIFIEPRTEATNKLKLSLPDWGTFVSAATLRQEAITINDALPSWAPQVRARFTDSFIDILKENGYSVSRLTHEQYLAQANPPVAALVVRTYIEPGFVYKTLGSSMYKPYVLVSIGISENSGRALYQTSLVATDRPFNILTAHEPASTPYAFSSIESLYSAPEQALEALSALSAQVGKKLAINAFRQ